MERNSISIKKINLQETCLSLFYLPAFSLRYFQTPYRMSFKTSMASCSLNIYSCLISSIILLNLYS